MTVLSGKIAVITGAASGIGKAISTSFVKAGATVYMSDVNIDGGEKVCAELQKINSDTSFMKTDVSKEEEVMHHEQIIHGKDSQYDCKECNKNFSNMEDMRTHLQREHSYKKDR